jgi:magnesium-transporting ATPase (P-type)
MGRRRSDVAKEAAVVVGTDDNFASIVAAIRPGRAAYANIGKFVTHIFASNVSELVPFLAFVFRILLPLTVMQIRAVDLVPALALAEKPVLNGRHVLTTVHPAAAMRFPCSAPLSARPSHATALARRP